MYLTPRRFFEKFIVEEKITRLDSIGRVSVEFSAVGKLMGIISSAEPHEIEKWRGLKHTITHKIVQYLGKISANVGDKLIKGDKVYFVEAVNDVSSLGQFIIYYVSERSDVK